MFFKFVLMIFYNVNQFYDYYKKKTRNYQHLAHLKLSESNCYIILNDLIHRFVM